MASAKEIFQAMSGKLLQILGWNYGICNSPIIEEVCISISELSNLPKVRRLLFLFKYMTIVQYRRYVA